MRLKRLKIGMTMLIVLMGVSIAVQAETIDCSVEGKPLYRELMGQYWKSDGATYIATSLRGVAGGVAADTYNWKTLEGGCDWLANVDCTTLKFLQEGRNRETDFLMTVNVFGTGPTSTEMGDFHYTLTPTDCRLLSPLTTMAADWVRYCNYMVQNYTTSSPPTSGNDLTIYNNLSWLGGAKLPTNSEGAIPKVTYWEIGNEPDGYIDNFHGENNDVMDSNPNTVDEFDVKARYLAITNAMRAQDANIKVGPCMVELNPAIPGHFVRRIIQDSNCHIDFVAYHPYDNLGEAWGSSNSMEGQLRYVRTHQFNWYQNACAVITDPDNNPLTSDGRNPGTLEFIPSEWNPMSCYYYANGEQKSQAQALGVAETIFTFADIGFRASYFWTTTRDPNGTVYPSNKVFMELKRLYGDRLIDAYFDNNTRVYTTRNDKTGRVVIWGLNFSNDNNTTVNLELQNLGLNNKEKTVFERTLSNSSGYTGLMDTMPGTATINWYVNYISGFNPSNYNFTIQKSRINALVIAPRAKNDHDGDGCSDLVIYRPSQGRWYVRTSSSSFTDSTYYDAYSDPTDTPMPGNPCGDGRIDHISYRAGAQSTWSVDYSYPNIWNGTTDLSRTWGTTGDIPICGDYDFDGKTDLVCYRPSNKNWYILKSSDSFNSSRTITISSAQAGDIPVTGDFDGDGYTDIAFYRPISTGSYWYVFTSSSNYANSTGYWLGDPDDGDIPVCGDFDGDGKTDVAVYHPSAGSSTWWIKTSSSSYQTIKVYTWGDSSYNDQPITGDFDGDGRTDIAAFRPSTGLWNILLSSYSFQTSVGYFYGNSTDVVVGQAKYYR